MQKMYYKPYSLLAADTTLDTADTAASDNP